MSSIDLLKFMLPEFLIENFEIVSATNFGEKLHLYFEEKSKPPVEFDAVELVSKSFLDEITIQEISHLEVSLCIYTLNVVVGPIKPMEKSS